MVMNSYWVLGPSYTIALKMGNCESYFKVSFIGDGQLLTGTKVLGNGLEGKPVLLLLWDLLHVNTELSPER